MAVGARNGIRLTDLNLRATDGNRLPRSRARLHHRATLCRSRSSRLFERSRPWSFDFFLSLRDEALRLRAQHARSSVFRPHASLRAQRSLRTRAWTRFGQSRARMVVVDRVAHWDCATWPRGDHYTLFARAAFKGSGSSRATTVGFALEGRGGGSPAPTKGGPPEGRRGPSESRIAVGDEEPPRLPLDHKEPGCSVRGLRPCDPSGEGTAQTPRFPPRAPLSGGSAPRRIRFPVQHRTWRSARVTGPASLT